MVSRSLVIAVKIPINPNQLDRSSLVQDFTPSRTSNLSNLLSVCMWICAWVHAVIWSVCLFTVCKSVSLITSPGYNRGSPLKSSRCGSAHTHKTYSCPLQPLASCMFGFLPPWWLMHACRRAAPSHV